MMIHKKNAIVATFISFLAFVTIAGCGTLGGIGNGLYFPISKKKLEIGIDSLYAKNPVYRMPENWAKFNTWSSSGYDFIESRIFYFRTPPEEMYYITFIGDSAALADTTKIAIGIRAVNKGSYKWLLEVDLDSREKERIVKRFNAEIVSKLKQYTGTDK